MDQNLRTQPDQDAPEDGGAGLDTVNTVKTLASNPDIFWDVLGLTDAQRQRTRELLKFGSAPFVVPNIFKTKGKKKNKLWPPYLKEKLERARDAWRKSSDRKTSACGALLRHHITLERVHIDARRDWEFACWLIECHDEAWRRWLRYLEVRNGPLTDRERRADAIKIWRAVTDPARARLLDQHDQKQAQSIACRKAQPYDDPLRLDKITARDNTANFFDEEAWLGEIAALDVEPGAGEPDIGEPDIGRDDIINAASAIDTQPQQCATADSVDATQWASAEDGEVTLASGMHAYFAHGMYYLRTDRDRPISAPTDSRVARAEKELDAAGGRVRKAADEWINLGGDPGDDDWDDDTDDDEARARERWRNAQDEHQRAAEKSRILKALRNDPEVRAFTEKHKVFSSSFAYDPPDQRSPEEWGCNNVETFLAAWDRQWARNQAAGRHQTRFRLGKVVEHIALPLVNQLPQHLVELPRSPNAVVKNTRASGTPDWTEPAAPEKQQREAEYVKAIENERKRGRIRARWWARREWQWRLMHARDANAHVRCWQHLQWSRKYRHRLWPDKLHEAWKRTTKARADQVTARYQDVVLSRRGVVASVIPDPKPAFHIFGMRLLCTTSGTFLPWIVNEEAERSPTRVARGLPAAVDWLRRWKGATPALASPYTQRGQNQPWHLGSARIDSMLWRPILVVVRWLNEKACPEPHRCSLIADEACMSSVHQDFARQVKRRYDDPISVFRRPNLWAGPEDTRRWWMPAAKGGLGSHTLPKNKRAADWKLRRKGHRAERRIQEGRHHATKLAIVEGTIDRGAHKTWDAD